MLKFAYMQASLLKQYKNIHETIVKNVETIKMMVEQAKELQTIAESIGKAGQMKTKEQLEQQAAKMNKSISDLIDQTTELFRLYDEFAEEIFGNQAAYG